MCERERGVGFVLFFFVCCCCGGGGGGGGDKNVRFPLISPDFNSFSLLSQFSFSLFSLSLSLFLSLCSSP